MVANGTIAGGIAVLLLVSLAIYYAVQRYEGDRMVPLAMQAPQYTDAEIAELTQYTCEQLPEEQQDACREAKQEMLFSGQCEKLEEIDPVSGQVCHELYRGGVWPRPLGVAVNPKPLVPANFADQEAANEPTPWRDYHPPQTLADGKWTLDLDQVDDKGIDDAAPYQSSQPSQTTRERYWNPVKPIGERSQLQEWQLVEPLPLM